MKEVAKLLSVSTRTQFGLVISKSEEMLFETVITSHELLK